MGIKLTATQAIEAIFVAEKSDASERQKKIPAGDLPRDPLAERRATEQALAR